MYRKPIMQMTSVSKGETMETRRKCHNTIKVPWGGGGDMLIQNSVFSKNILHE